MSGEPIYDADALFARLVVHRVHIDGAWDCPYASPPGVTVRISSNGDAEHDTYHNGWGATFGAALADAVRWCDEVLL